MIDIHTHFLPGIDDGAQSMDEALHMLRLLIKDGVTHVVATPHIYPGRYENERVAIEAAMAVFRAAIVAQNLQLSLGVAGEVRLTEHLPDMLARDAIPFLGTDGDYRFMLLELPDDRIPVGTTRLLRWLMKNGVRPVLVHPERNRMIAKAPAIIESLIEIGCLLQLTASSLLGQWGPRALLAARYLLDRDWVAAVASDAHDCRLRPPRLGEARDWLLHHYGAACAERLTHEGPARLCAPYLPSAACAA